MQSQESLNVRQNLYACCAGRLGLLASQQKDYGMDCYRKTEDRSAFLLYMVSLLCRMPENPTCITDKELCALIEEADKCCVNYGQKPCPPTIPAPIDCTITPFATVITAIPFDELPIPCSINLDFNNDWNNDWNADVPCVNVQPGDSYYILTGPNAGAVYTWAAQPDFNNDYNIDFNTTQ